jgi:ribose 5-phosphate isomerase B
MVAPTQKEFFMIAIASDHAAFTFKEEIKTWLAEKGVETRDFGCFSAERADYPDFGFAASEAVARGECELGILICGTGVGMAITANKVRGIRAVVCSEPCSARLSRQHNNANILALGARIIGPELAKMIIETWLSASFEGGRHADRVGKIMAYEEQHAVR